jgi:hypothetical protein
MGEQEFFCTPNVKIGGRNPPIPEKALNVLKREIGTFDLHR